MFYSLLVSLTFSFETADVFPTNHAALAILIILRDPENEDLVPFHSSRQETSGSSGNGNVRLSLTESELWCLAPKVWVQNLYLCAH